MNSCRTEFTANIGLDHIERQAGLLLWDRLRGEKVDKLKLKKGRMWSQEKARRAAIQAEEHREII